MRGVLLRATQTWSRNLIYDFNALFRQYTEFVSTKFVFKLIYHFLFYQLYSMIGEEN